MIRNLIVTMLAMPAIAGAQTPADVHFMQHMIGHHAQAIEMAALAGTRAGPKVQRLAEKIAISQRDEIKFMQTWLVDHKQEVPDSAHARHMMMPGMLSELELQQLEASHGLDFDKLFLSGMIRHHEGALQMVAELFRTPNAAQDSDVFRFVTDVDADQRDEIYVMQQLLDTLERDDP